MNKQLSASLVFALSLAVGCAPVGDAPDGLDSNAQEVVNGNVISDQTAAVYGLARVNWGTLLCSGVIYKNSWVLTASHCFNFTTPTSGVTVTVGGVTYASDRVRTVSTADLALVHLTSPIPVNGSTTGYTVPFYQGTLPSLQGQGLYCFGYGTNSFAPTGGALIDGRARWAYLTVSSFYVEGPFYSFAPNASGQILGGGDSGGPCFAVQSGRMVLSGISRNAGRVCANLAPGQTCSDATATSIDWSDQTYVPSLAATMNYLSGGVRTFP